MNGGRLMHNEADTPSVEVETYLGKRIVRAMMFSGSAYEFS
jgi:hypothetical protein